MSYASMGIRKFMTEIVEEAVDKRIPEIIDEILKAGGTVFRPDELKK